MTPQELRRRLALLDPVGTVTESLELALDGPRPRTTWYETQQEHLLEWLREYSRPGYYGRANSDRTAEFVYKHFKCAPGLMWIAQAAGAPRALLIGNSDKDSIFPLDGVVRLHKKVAAIYGLYNQANNLGLLITEGPH